MIAPRALLVLVLLAVCRRAVGSPSLVAREAALLQVQEARDNPLAVFKQWVSEHEKEYVDDQAEFTRRFIVWKRNVFFIQEYNSMHADHWLGITVHTDLTNEEFRATRLGFNRSAAATAPRHVDVGSAEKLAEIKDYADVVRSMNYPAEVDWVRRGAVTEVKNQKACGGCWAFSTTGAIEGINAIFSHDLVSLSEQELLDCDAVDQACKGGVMDHAFEWVIKNGGIDTEQHYGYHASKGTCDVLNEERHVVSIQSYADVPEYNTYALLAAVARQPVSVAVQASTFAFQHYRGGVLTADCGTKVDHGVLLVGYGSDRNGGDLWKIKNSWGPYWGEQGFIRIKRTMSAWPSSGQCGILTMSSYPIKTEPNPPVPCCLWLPFTNICLKRC